MAIPDYQSIMLPLLRYLGDGLEKSNAEATDTLALQFQLTPQESNERTSNGQKTVLYDRVTWAKTYLKRQG